MIILDAHCDTITKIMEKGENLLNNSCHLDIKRMKNYNNVVQFFAAFIDPIESCGHPMRSALRIIDKFYEQIDAYNADISYCSNYNEIMDTLKNKKIAAFLTIEGGDCLEGELSALRIFYKLGVRSLILTWNHRNEIADGVGESITGGGLTTFGRKVIREMNELGMLIDVSHISETGFWDVIELTKAPIIASHSNAKEICKNRRNLTNLQIEAIKKNNGVIGINLYPPFLTDSGNASLKDVIAHIEHIVAISGENHIGLGADFDGIDTTPIDIRGVQDTEAIFNELLKLNYSQSFIEKFAGGNFLRVIKMVC
jgi:membrane dipeptidase